MRGPRLARDADAASRRERYEDVLRSIEGLLDGEDDWIAAMATVACELHGAFGHYDWTGFYRALGPGLLVVGPYQGGHGCLRIEGGRGVCGAAAATGHTQEVPDVHSFPGHIACSATTRSEIVVPIVTPERRLLAVLDVDSDDPAAFGPVDRDALEALCRRLGRRFARHAVVALIAATPPDPDAR
jgi:GAF domain-containing protein